MPTIRKTPTNPSTEEVRVVFDARGTRGGSGGR